MNDKNRANLMTGAVVVLVLVLIVMAYQLGQRRATPVPAPSGSVVSPTSERAAPSSPAASAPSAPTQTGTPVYSWQDAASHYGEYCTIEGQIVATHNSGKACFLNFHPNWKTYFTAVIFASDFHKFPANPEDYYRGKHVRVTGAVKEYEGKPEIILSSPAQIEIIEEN